MTEKDRLLTQTMLIGTIALALIWCASGFFTALGVFVALWANNVHEEYRGKYHDKP